MSRADHESPEAFLVFAEGGAGLTRKQTRGAGFVSPSRGVRVRRDRADHVDARASAALLACRDDAVLSDLAAARALGLPLPPWIALAQAPAALSVAVPAGQARPKRAGVRGRRLDLPLEHVLVHDGQRMTTPARTWLDCSPAIPMGHLVAMGDAVLHRRLSSVAELEDMVRWGRGRRGIVGARQALRLLDGDAESPGESLTRVILLAGGVPRPRCNANVLDVFGGWIARGDLVWDREHVIVEYDGEVHLDETRRRSDAARRNLLQDSGWLVIVFTARDLKHPEAMCAMVSSALRRRQ